MRTVQSTNHLLIYNHVTMDNNCLLSCMSPQLMLLLLLLLLPINNTRISDYDRFDAKFHAQKNRIVLYVIWDKVLCEIWGASGLWMIAPNETSLLLLLNRRNELEIWNSEIERKKLQWMDCSTSLHIASLVLKLSTINPNAERSWMNLHLC